MGEMNKPRGELFFQKIFLCMEEAWQQPCQIFEGPRDNLSKDEKKKRELACQRLNSVGEIMNQYPHCLAMVLSHQFFTSHYTFALHFCILGFVTYFSGPGAARLGRYPQVWLWSLSYITVHSAMAKLVCALFPCFVLSSFPMWASTVSSRIPNAVISIGTGCVMDITCEFLKKPFVLIDEFEKASLEPSFPMREYVAPVSTMKECCCPWIRTGMMGSTLGCDEMTGDSASFSSFSGHPSCQLALGPIQGLSPRNRILFLLFFFFFFFFIPSVPEEIPALKNSKILNFSKLVIAVN